MYRSAANTADDAILGYAWPVDAQHASWCYASTRRRWEAWCGDIALAHRAPAPFAVALPEVVEMQFRATCARCRCNRAQSGGHFDTRMLTRLSSHSAPSAIAPSSSNAKFQKAIPLPQLRYRCGFTSSTRTHISVAENEAGAQVPVVSSPTSRAMPGYGRLLCACKQCDT